MQPKLMDINSERADQQTAAPAARCDHAGLARTDALQPAAPDRRGDAEQHEEQREHPAQAGHSPVAGGGEQLLHQRHVRAGLARRQPDRARQRQPEHAEAIGHADAQMNAKRRRRHQPAIEAGLCDRVLAIENPSPPRDIDPAFSIVAIQTSPAAALFPGQSAIHDPLYLKFLIPHKHMPCCSAPFRAAPAPKARFEIPNTREDRLCRSTPPVRIRDSSTQDCVRYYRRDSTLRPPRREPIGAEAAPVSIGQW